MKTSTNGSTTVTKTDAHVDELEKRSPVVSLSNRLFIDNYGSTTMHHFVLSLLDSEFI